MTIEKLELPKRLDEERIAALKDLFPEVFADGRVNLEALKDALADIAEDDEVGDEHYGLTWPGKKQAKKLAVMPPTGTLVPMPGEGIDEETTKNIFIEGDNLEVLRILQKSYAGRIKMIYIDPPYNTGNDFIYKDDFKEPIESYLRRTGQSDEEGLLTSNPKANGRYHSNWLSMMYPRLKLASRLLSEDGFIFISIDDNEAARLKIILDEIFGENNFVSQIIIESNKRGQTYKDISKTHEYLFCYAKSEESSIFELEKEDKNLQYKDDSSTFDIRELRNRNPKFGKFNRPNLYYPIYVDISSPSEDGFCAVSLTKSNKFTFEVFPLNSEGKESCWRWGKSLFEKNAQDDVMKGNLVAKQKRDGGYNVYEKYRKTTYKAKSIWDETELINEQGTIDLKQLGLGGLFDFPKPVALLIKCLSLATDKNDIVMDFFSGSSTIAQAVFQKNSEDLGERNFICVQLPVEVPVCHPAYSQGYKKITDVSKERIRKSSDELKQKLNASGDFGFKCFSLAESNIDTWKNKITTSVGSVNDLFDSKTNRLADNFKSTDVVVELLLILGFPLSSTCSPLKIGENNLFIISHQDIDFNLKICLDKQLRSELINSLNDEGENIFVCLDSALTDQIKLTLSDSMKIKTL